MLTTIYDGVGCSMVKRELESASDCHVENHASWVTAKELAGLVGMPTTDRRTRDILDELASKVDGSKRKRSGTKAFEYHVSILPKQLREQFINDPEMMLDKYNKLGADIDSSLGTNVSGTVIRNALGTHLPSETLDEISNVVTQSRCFSVNDVVNVSACIHDDDNISDDINSTVPVSGKWLRNRNLKPSDLAFYVQTGYSMANRINPNDIVIVNTSDNRLVDGSMVVFLLDGYVLVRYLQKSLGGWTLRCENPTYQPVKLIFRDNNSYKILGHVVRIISDV